MTAHARPFAQEAYQVRFEWGVAGLQRLAASDVVVVVDVLGFSTTVTDAAARGDAIALVAAGSGAVGGSGADAGSGAGPGSVILGSGASVAAAAEASGALVLVGCLRNAAAVARAVLAWQVQRGARTSIAVIAVGEPAAAAGGGLRFAVEDQLGAGAVIDALADLGIDHSSPEAAVTGESFRALRGAVRHLVTASGSGRERAAAVGGTDPAADVRRAAELDAETAVPVLRDGVFRAL